MDTPVVYQDALADMKGTTKANLDRIADESRGRGFKAECFVGIGGPADEIQRMATEHGAGLIVMSTHGRSVPRRWVMGSVADAVVRRTHLPCLLIRPQQAQHPPDDQNQAPD
jgi:nucleotide-binding universal stress UspA family protein